MWKVESGVKKAVRLPQIFSYQFFGYEVALSVS